MSAFNYSSTEETTNTNRACRLLLGPCTDALRELLRHHVPPSQFPQVIQQYNPNLPRLTAVQRSLILPQHGHYSGNYDDIDISLLYILLRNICNIPAHSKCWGNDPDSSDISLSANIERIRLARNERGHSSDASLSNTDFNILWTTLRSAVMEIDSFLSNNNQFTNQVDSLRHETMDPVRDKCFAEQLKQQAEEDQATRVRVATLEKRAHKFEEAIKITCKQKIDQPDKKKKAIYEDLGQELQELQIRLGPDLQIMIDTTRKMLFEFEKEIHNLFVTTRASENVMNVLKTKRCVFIKGNPGDGKTTIPKYILLKFEERGMKPMQMLSLANFYGKVPGCSKLVIFIDDMFGERSVLKDEVHYFNAQKDLIKATLSDDEQGNSNMFIATLRNDIHRECENTMKNTDFFNNCIVDISDTENKINGEEFESFVSKYALQDTIVSVDEILKIRNLGCTIGIPQSIKILKSIAQSKANIHDIFEDPLKHLQKEIKLRIKDKEHKTAVLIYILLCGGSIKDDILKNPAKDKERKRKALKIMELEENASSMTDFHDSIRFYEGSYIKHDDIDDEYRFTHSSVQESIFLYTCQHYPKDIISACDPSLLITLSTAVSPNTILIDTDLFPDLIDRFKMILKGGKISDFRSISLMILWSDDEFSKEVKQNEECKQSMVDSIDERDDSMSVHFSGAGNINWVKYLLLRSINEQRYKSLNKACSYNHIDVVDLILGENVNFDLKTCFFAVQSGNIEMLFRFTSKIDLTQTSFSNDPTWSFLRGGLLHEICFFGQNQMIDPVLERYPSLLDVRNEQGGNALHFVAYAGKKDTFTMLINRGSDPYCRTNHGSTVLHYACQNGKIDMVKYICETYPELWTKKFDDYKGRSPLHWAAQSGNIELYEYLLKKCLTTDLTNNGKSVLHISCMNGRLELCKYIVKNYPKLLEVIDNDGETVLHDSSWGGNVDIFKLLIEKGFDIKSTTHIGKTVLHQCCIYGKLEMCKYLVKKHPDLLNVIDNYGYTVLHDAALGGNLDLFSYLLTVGKNVNDLTNNGRSVLHISCMKGHQEMCKYLVKNYSDLLNVTNNDGCTVLHDAALGGNLDLFSYLLTVGKNVSDLTNNGGSVLHISCMNGHLEMCKYLVENHPKLLKVIVKNGLSVLNAAAFGGNVEVLNLLIEKGLDIKSTTHIGKTVLHQCCRNGKLEMCKYLVKKHPDLLNISDNDGYTVLHDAIKGGNLDLVSYLLTVGKNVNDLTNNGRSVIHISCLNGQFEVCKYLVKNHPKLHDIINKNWVILSQYAVVGGNVDIFKLVMEKGLNENNKKVTKIVLHQCLMNGRLEMYKYLVSHHPDLVEIVDNDGETALHAAAWGGNVDLFKLLIDKGLDVNRKTKKGKTVLHKCCMNGKLQMCKYLVNHQPQLLTVKDFHGVNTLHDAARGGVVELFTFLLEKGLDVNSKTNNGQTVLHRCCHEGKKEMFDYLIQSRPDLIEVLDNDGNTVLHIACVQQQTEMCSALVDRFPDLLDIENRKGKRVVIYFVNGARQFKMISHKKCQIT